MIGWTRSGGSFAAALFRFVHRWRRAPARTEAAGLPNLQPSSASRRASPRRFTAGVGRFLANTSRPHGSKLTSTSRGRIPAAGGRETATAAGRRVRDVRVAGGQRGAARPLPVAAGRAAAPAARSGVRRTSLRRRSRRTTARSLGGAPARSCGTRLLHGARHIARVQTARCIT